MSDYRAIAATTATLRSVLHHPVQTALGAQVKIGRPMPPQLDPEVRVFMYQVEPNAFQRNSELPVRSQDGQLINLPQISLNLHYLLTFYGDESKLQPELLIGASATYLHTNPSPTTADVEAAITEAETDGVNLSGCGLPEQAHLLQWVPTELNTEDMQRLWSVFFQQPYVLSLAYRCSVVLLQPDLLTRAAPGGG